MFEKLMYLLAPLIDKASTLWASITAAFSKLPVPAAAASSFLAHIACLVLLSFSFLTNNTLFAQLIDELVNRQPGQWTGLAAVVTLLAGSVSFTLLMFSLTFSRAYAQKLEKAKTLWQVELVVQKQIDLAEQLRTAVIDASRFKLNEPPRAELPTHIDDWLVDVFAAEMRRVLREKREAGWKFWNVSGIDNLRAAAEEQFTAEDPNLVHIANYAAMLWARAQYAHACANPGEVLAPPSIAELMAKAQAKNYKK